MGEREDSERESEGGEERMSGERSTLSRACARARKREESEENFPPRASPRDGNIFVARVRAKEEKRKEEKRIREKKGEKGERVSRKKY